MKCSLLALANASAALALVVMAGSAQGVACVVQSGACVYALTSVPSDATVNNARFIVNGNVDNVGTGVLDSFLRVQNNGTEGGWNNDYGNPQQQFDEKTGVWTHTLLWSDRTVVTYAGTQYLEFGLDINQTVDSQIVLDQLQLFVDSGLAPAGSYNTGNGTLDGLTALYDLDAGGNNQILLDYANFSGSGNGLDMVVLIPLANFGSPSDSSYLYLYSHFGTAPPGNAASNDGFEEWSHATGGNSIVCPPGNQDPNCGGNQQQIPEPATLALVGLGLFGVRLSAQRRRKDC